MSGTGRGLPGSLEPQGPVELVLYQDLAAALPVVLVNLTSYAGQISDEGHHSANVTHHFGVLAADLAELFDKVSGFTTLLQDALASHGGESLCPRNRLNHIKECLMVCTCLLGTLVPQHLELAMYTSYLEMVGQFADHAWPQIQERLRLEAPPGSLSPDDVASSSFQCDAFQHKQTPSAPSLLEESHTTHAAFAMTAALSGAMRSTHRILDGHSQGSASLPEKNVLYHNAASSYSHFPKCPQTIMHRPK